MMQKLWQKKLKLNYSNDVFDIIQFGSSTIEKTISNDIDIAVVFHKIPLKEQLNQAEEIKIQLQKRSSIPIDITVFDLYSFFSEGNFAKEGILIYGKSIISKSYFSEKLGLLPMIQISYALKNLKKKDKVRFHYSIRGKKGKYGLLKKYGGNLLHPGLIEIYPEYERIFVETISKLTKKFKIKKILFKK